MVRDKLDPITSVTITTSTAPLVLYRESSARTALNYEYVGVGPIRINRMGEYHYYLWLEIWSTAPTRTLSELSSELDSITIFADGEPLPLTVHGRTLASIQASEPIYKKSASWAAEAYYPVTIDQIRIIAHAGEVRIGTGGSPANLYTPWDNHDEALAGLRAFLDSVTF